MLFFALLALLTLLATGLHYARVPETWPARMRGAAELAGGFGLLIAHVRRRAGREPEAQP